MGTKEKRRLSGTVTFPESYSVVSCSWTCPCLSGAKHSLSRRFSRDFASTPEMTTFLQIVTIPTEGRNRQCSEGRYSLP